MAKANKPVQDVGSNGGIYQEVGSRDGEPPNYATVPDNKKLPPTTESSNSWKQVTKMPDWFL
jgi:hypothetical protein